MGDKLYLITPVPKPRMTQRDKRGNPRPAVARYWAFRDEVRLAKIRYPEHGTSVVFMLPMPQSWPGPKRRAHHLKPHQQRPDISNLLKALEDAVFAEDARIWSYERLSKVWAHAGGILICF